MQNDPWDDGLVGERVRGIIGRMQARPADLEHITEILHSNAAPTDEPKEHTAEHAADVITWNVEDLIRQTAAKRGIDRAELHRQVFRRLTLTSFRLRERPNDLVEDVRDVATEYKHSQSYAGSGY
jgi:hypothetical protein